MNKETGSLTPYNRNAVIFISIPCAISLLAIIGWMIGRPTLASLLPSYIPMAPTTSLIFLLLGILWFTYKYFGDRPGLRIIIQISLMGLLIVVFLLTLRYFTGYGPDLEQALVPNPPLFGQILSARMSPLTAMGFILSISAFLILTLRRPGKRVKTTAASISVVVLLLGVINCIGYLYGAPLFYGGKLIPEAVTTALSFVFLSLGLLMTAGPNCWPINIFIGPSPKARLMRTFVPASVFIVLLQGFLSSVYDPLNINPAVKVAAAALLACLIVIVTISQNAKNLSSEIEHVNQIRITAQSTLMESELRFHNLFDASPISLWEEDFSAVKQRLDGLRSDGVTDFEDYLCNHPEVVEECASLVKVTDVNKATLDLYGASSKEEMLNNLAIIFPQKLNKYFRNELVKIASGVMYFEMENINQTLDGRLITVSLNWTVVPGYERNLSKTILSLIDITLRKKAEEEKLKAETSLRHLSAAIEQSPVTTVITDLLGNIVFVNP
jgi:PAS domain S-box-containing protein